MTTFEHQVTVPDEFFQKSKSEYHDWRWAFIREVIQNAYDAGATEIEFDLHPQTPKEGQVYGDSLITCYDNGSGMDRSTLIEVLLALGGSKKPAGSVGGFGYAKHILFFCHSGYEIRTHEWLVAGKGGHYNISQTKPYVDGTDISVLMPAEADMQNTFESLLRTYVRFMNPERPVNIYFAGELVKQTPTAFTYAVDHELGTLRFDDSSEQMVSLVVTVNGLPMFRHREYNVDRGCRGILELKGVSYDILTTNREGFRGDLRQQFIDLVRKIIIERFTLKRKPTISIGFNVQSPIVESQTDSQNTNLHYPTNFVVHIANDKVENTGVAITSAIKLLNRSWVASLAHAWRFYVYAVMCTKFAQEAMGLMVLHDGKQYVPNIKYIEENLERLDSGKLIFIDGDKREILPGFILDPELEGANKLDRRLRLVMVNPDFYEKGFRHGDVLDLVFHELTHLAVSGHGDGFIDYEMKLRRSFRRMVSEVALRKQVKAFLETV